jgi:hypothetical protein
VAPTTDRAAARPALVGAAVQCAVVVRRAVAPREGSRRRQQGREGEGTHACDEGASVASHALLSVAPAGELRL